MICDRCGNEFVSFVRGEKYCGEKANPKSCKVKSKTFKSMRVRTKATQYQDYLRIAVTKETDLAYKMALK